MLKREERAVLRTRAIAEFDASGQRNDGTSVVQSLSDGLTCLRKLLFERIHDDVERTFGMDSMLMPVSEARTRGKTLLEIEIYQIAIAAVHATSRGYVDETQPWFLDWLERLRIGSEGSTEYVKERLSLYLSLEKADRRLAFTDALVHALREAERAPLVLYRLFPLAIKIVVAVAFGDLVSANEERKRQIAFLPAITDCNVCHGRALDNGEFCQVCGNPVWRYDWLNAIE